MKILKRDIGKTTKTTNFILSEIENKVRRIREKVTKMKDRQKKIQHTYKWSS